jgi:hyperosmotically inducible periplasmic protein
MPETRVTSTRQNDSTLRLRAREVRSFHEESDVMFNEKVRRLARTSMMAACLAMPAAVELQASQAPKPDNSKVNERDRRPTQSTADQQSNDPADVETTRQIRKAITADKSLSTYAHNVKVITQGGKVTLKGPVRSADEKKTIAEKAAEVAGAQNVNNQLTVAPPASASKKEGS